MNSLKALNQTIQYIEDNLEGMIDDAHIAQLCGCPEGVFARIFSILCDVPLGEYIRLRKLSKAAEALQSSRMRVIDIAVQYGYESADAFSAAFRRFHGSTPSEIRNGRSFLVFPPIHFSLSVEGGKNMNIRIEKKAPFKIAGITLKVAPSSDFPKLWQDLFQKIEEEKLIALGTGQSYGACYDMSSERSFSYMAGFDLCDEKAAIDLGLEILSVPAATYAVLELRGPVPECIHQGWKYVLGTFFPDQGYQHAGSPDFEVYQAGDMYSPDYHMELWVPVEKE